MEGPSALVMGRLAVDDGVARELDEDHWNAQSDHREIERVWRSPRERDNSPYGRKVPPRTCWRSFAARAAPGLSLRGRLLHSYECLETRCDAVAELGSTPRDRAGIQGGDLDDGRERTSFSHPALALKDARRRRTPSSASFLAWGGQRRRLERPLVLMLREHTGPEPQQ